MSVQRGPFIAQYAKLWLPVFTFTTPGDLAVAYTTQDAVNYYTNKFVLMRIALNFTPTFATASGITQITGNPDTPALEKSTLSRYLGDCLFLSAITYPAGVSDLKSSLLTTGNVVQINGQGSSIPYVNFTTAQFVSGVAQQLRASIVFERSNG